MYISLSIRHYFTTRSGYYGIFFPVFHLFFRVFNMTLRYITIQYCTVSRAIGQRSCHLWCISRMDDGDAIIRTTRYSSYILFQIYWHSRDGPLAYFSLLTHLWNNLYKLLLLADADLLMYISCWQEKLICCKHAI